MNKKTHTFVTALLILTFGLSAAYGQYEENNDSSVSFEQNANSIVGTWLADVTVSNCQGTILGVVKALNTFNKGGTMIESATPVMRGPGHGTWERTKGNQYSSVFVFYRFTPDGVYAGFQKVRRSHILSSDGTTLTTTATFQIFDANSNPVISACATETATRLIE